MGIKAALFWMVLGLALVTASGYYFGFNYETTIAYIGIVVVVLIILGAELLHKGHDKN